jgi:hypothetical protein
MEIFFWSTSPDFSMNNKPVYQQLEVNQGKSQSVITGFDLSQAFMSPLAIGVIIVVILGVVTLLRFGTDYLTKEGDALKRAKISFWRKILAVIAVLFAPAVLANINTSLTKIVVPVSQILPGTNIQIPNNPFPTSSSTSATTTPPSSGPIGTCASPSLVASSFTSSSFTLCGTTCNKTCDLSAFMPIIKEVSSNNGIDYRVIASLICKESSGNPKAEQVGNNNGSRDCGLMQINVRGSCDASLLDPKTNIEKGVALYKQKLSQVSSFSYGSIPKEVMAFASYNCCGNGDNPNAKSVDCNSTSGFPTTPPKWACPINPGTGSSNMCAVKNYACDVYNCIVRY